MFAVWTSCRGYSVISSHFVATVSSAGILVPIRLFRNALKQIHIRTLRTYALGLRHIRLQRNTCIGRFIMFSVITNIYNKKTKGPTLMEFFTATRKLKKFFF